MWWVQSGIRMRLHGAPHVSILVIKYGADLITALHHHFVLMKKGVKPTNCMYRFVPWNAVFTTCLFLYIFCITSPLHGEFTGHWWIPLTKASDTEHWCFPWSAPDKKRWVNNREAGDSRCHRTHYGVIVMFAFHYDDVTMSLMASQITSLTVVYSTVYSDVDQRKHQSSASLALCGEFTGTGEFPAQRASFAEYVSIWWRHHVWSVSNTYL